tara:strand:- start:2521 stop:2802 length:282 start_codon:yes stop_codon:yes gene_type:complete
MDFSHLLNFLGPFHQQFSKFYSIASYAISAIIILWVFNLIAGFVYRTYLLGKTFGKLYRTYFHGFLKSIFSQVFYLFRIKEKVSGNIHKSINI